jgi:hypothetical protein
VVSTQNPHLNCHGPAPAAAPSGEFPDDAALEAELEDIWNSVQGEAQPINAHVGSQDEGSAQGDNNFILPSQIPGHRYANSQTNASMVIPRRIDHDQKLAVELAYFITLSNIPRSLYPLLSSSVANWWQAAPLS